MPGQPPSTIAARIARLGFRRWYERQLIECHAWLVTAFLSLILVLSVLEAFGDVRSAAGLATGLALSLGGAVLCVLALGRYLGMLQLAERLGNHATCNACHAYGRFEVLASGSGKEGPWMRVRCRNCRHEWHL